MYSPVGVAILPCRVSKEPNVLKPQKTPALSMAKCPKCNNNDLLLMQIRSKISGIGSLTGAIQLDYWCPSCGFSYKLP